MKKLVIHLSRRKDRKKLFLKNNLDKIKDFEWLEAVDGRELTHQKLLEMGFDTDRNCRSIYGEPNRKLVRGEIGCFLSHKKAWDIVAQQNEPMMILEDDAIVFENYDEEYYESLVEKYNIIYLDWKEWEPSKTIKIDDKIHVPSFPHCLSAYIITPETARILGNEEIMQNIISADEYVPLMLKHLSPCAVNTQSVGQEPRIVAGTDIQNHIDDEWFIDFDVHKICTNEQDTLNQKHILVESYIKDLPDHDVVFIVDGMNSSFDLDEINKKYLGFKCSIVFSSGHECLPEKTLAEMFQKFPRTRASQYTKDQYLNFNYCMALVGELKSLFKDIDNSPEMSESELMVQYQELFLSRKYDCILDYEKKLL